MRSSRRCSGSFLRVLNFSTRPYSSLHGPRDYNGAVAALNTLQSNSSIVESIRRRGPGTNRDAIPSMVEWIRRIGYKPADFDRLNPIHIAGTKGKGSTSTFISSILSQYLSASTSSHVHDVCNVGLYTSPHLRFVRERIQINNRPISEEQFAKCFWTIWDRLESSRGNTSTYTTRGIDDKPVYFHFLTLMALHCYLEEQVGTAVIECGIGGEYDTTNILVRPSVTGITSLGIDHESLLGNTIASIAWHKGGIFKDGVPAFTVPQRSEAMQVLFERANERSTVLHVVESHPALNDISLGLRGDFQKLNASLAVTISAQHLRHLGYTDVPDPYRPIKDLPSEFVRGLEKARLGGRCEKRQDRANKNLEWYLDGGHTLESIEVAGRWFASAIAQSQAQEPLRILLFNQQVRDASALIRHLHATLVAALHYERPFHHVIFCPNITYKDGGYKADLVSINTSNDDVSSLRVQRALATEWTQVDPWTDVHVVPTIEDAVDKARSIAGEQEAVVLATGSLHLVGGLTEVLQSEMERGLSMYG